ncbi:cobalamin-5'-phosphate synthase [Lachnospiraceae bacterium RM5]|nr:cobalamin-5'-phosphate synthase [Lachnospiraceae bacterium RM5]
MSIFKGMIIAFSIYSKIPVPVFEWKDDDMKYHLIFFPWIGVIIGALIYGWRVLVLQFNIGIVAYSFIGYVIPLLITGGFHVDGFMDTSDAIKSYKSKEEKLKILSDPHIGAFAVISFSLLSAIYIAAFSEISNKGVLVFVCSFAVTRALSAIAVLIFPSAKEKGMLHTFSKTGSLAGKIVLNFLILQLMALFCFMVWADRIYGIGLIITALISTLFYRHKMIKEFGGITGDTAGYFVCVTETFMAVVAAIISIVMSVI